MTKRSLVIGMGIGQLYSNVLTDLGHEVVTVDSDISKRAMLPTIESAVYAYHFFDTVHICTPNFTHEDIARKLAPYSKIIFIEKPGVINSRAWIKLITDFPQTRFMMVKNNMWRDNIKELKEWAGKAKTVDFNWINRDRVPNPGTWFTTKSLAFGGVSRDLMPHLLSLYVALNPNWRNEEIISYSTMMEWQLKDLLTTDYGVVNPDGTYDVDDTCGFGFGNKWNLMSKWRSMKQDCRSIEFVMQDNTEIRVELGLCPEDAYQAMIKEAVERVDDYEFWLNQFDIDTWIHERIENL